MDMRLVAEGQVSRTSPKTSNSDEELAEMLQGLKPSIRIFGCGGGGSNTIKRTFQENITGVDLIAVNTDAQHLLNIKAPKKLLIGKRRTRGLGAGALPQVGEEAAHENEDALRSLLANSDMVFVTCGLGGGTGTGSAPVVAEIARDLGALTLAVVTLPFKVEGEVRRQNAMAGLEKLRHVCDTVVTIPNDKLLELVPQLPIDSAFKVADEILMRAIKGITELVTKPGLVNLDFADLRTVLSKGGVAMFGLGEASGEERAVESVRKALHSPLLDVDIRGATSALINVTGGSDMTLAEAQKVADEIYQQVDPNARLIWGAQVEPSLQGTIRTMVVLTGVQSPQISGRVEAPASRGHGIDVIF